jgi:hypothetical protein
LFRFTDETARRRHRRHRELEPPVLAFFQMRRAISSHPPSHVSPLREYDQRSGNAGITGNNQEPINWGPPALAFSSMAGLSDALPRDNDTITHAGGVEGYLFRGRHNFTLGGDVRHHQIDILSQQDPRGTFTFTGAASGHDFADFLLGTPSAARSHTATPTSTSVASRTTPTSPMTGGLVHRSR